MNRPASSSRHYLALSGIFALTAALVFSVPAFAEDPGDEFSADESSQAVFEKPMQTIFLKDGTVIKGKLVGVLNDEYYVIETQHLGSVKVHISDFQGMTTGGQSLGGTSGGSQSSMEAMPSLNQMGANAGISNEQMTQIQQTLMSDPQMMAEIQKLMDDPEIMRLIQNGDIMAELSTMDPNRIQNNEDILKLMNNPNMQAVVEKVQQKLTPAQPAP